MRASPTVCRSKRMAKTKDWTILLLYTLAALAFLASLILGYPLLPGLLMPSVDQPAVPILGLNYDGDSAPAWASGAPLPLALLLLAITFYFAGRQRALRNKSLAQRAGCPNCQADALGRVHRRPADRLLALSGIPIGRFFCRECAWEGRRVLDRGKRSGDGDLLLESAPAKAAPAALEQPSPPVTPLVTPPVAPAVSPYARPPQKLPQQLTPAAEPDPLAHEPLQLLGDADQLVLVQAGGAAGLAEGMHVSVGHSSQREPRSLAWLEEGTAVVTLTDEQGQVLQTWRQIRVNDQIGWVRSSSQQ